MKHQILNGDCQEVLKTLDADSVDAVVTDPPYGLAMAGWDHTVPPKEIWAEVLRVLKPGGHMLAFGGTRTYHRLGCAIEDAGFELRDCIMWTHGMGFPKGQNLKPAWEPVWVCRKPGKGKLNIENTRVEFASDADKQATEYFNAKERPNSGGFATQYAGGEKKTYKKKDTGKLNIDDCRVPASKEDIDYIKGQYEYPTGFGNDYVNADKETFYNNKLDAPEGIDNGRHPANLIHDGSDEVLNGFPELGVAGRAGGSNGGCFGGGEEQIESYDDSGSAARFFYCAKATPAERKAANGHPTIKPLKLMRYLVKLVSNEGDVVLDPFMGSGSSIVAARLESRSAIGIDIDEEYCKTAQQRADDAMSGTLIDLFE